MEIPTRENSAVFFLDVQDGIVGNSRTVSRDNLQRSAGVLAKLCALHGIPTFVSAVPPGGEYLDAVLGPLGNPTPSMRTQTTAFADPMIVQGLRSSGRRVLILSGVASEIVVQRTALDALKEGYDVYVAVDACGGASERTEEAAWRRIVAAGGATTSVTTYGAELAGDFTTELGGKTLGLIYENIGA